jgi:hydroxyethylthiazole kinase-like uncharacterized protein yjeF
MERIRHSAKSLPLFDVARTRAIEQQALAGLAAHTLMRRAGAAVARLALALAPHAQRVWVAAGPGNNGGDGVDAAIHLHAAGKDVTITLVGDPQKLPADAKDAFERAQAAGLRWLPGPPSDIGETDIAIDALLGIGSSRAPDGTLGGCVDALNALPCIVLSVDVPSGLDVDTGQPFGARVVSADHTLTLLVLKPGLFTGAGRDHAGSVWLDDLECPVDTVAPTAWLAGAADADLPLRRHSQHKGSFGDVVVVGGAPSMGGAALLASRAALGAGAGRVYVSLLDAAAAALDPQRPELMFRRDAWKADDATLLRSTVVCGCGGGAAVRETLPRLRGAAGRLVLDADALNAIAADSQLQSQWAARLQRNRFTVITPHPLEAARLWGRGAADVQGDRLAAAQALADRFECVVVLKGSGTVIAAPAQTPRVNPTGNAALATAGTGDVLAGWLGGIWSQQASRGSIEQAMRAACVAAYAHGAAADMCGRRVLPAADLIEALQAGARGR